MAQEAVPPVLKAGQFPPPNTGTYLAGELVLIDPVNRRGGLRLDGNEPHDRYHSGPLHYFAMLSYGMVSFNGAPAELKDIPLGTHVHGYFYVPPVGEEATIPPLPPLLRPILHNPPPSPPPQASTAGRNGNGEGE